MTQSLLLFDGSEFDISEEETEDDDGTECKQVRSVVPACLVFYALFVQVIVARFTETVTISCNFLVQAQSVVEMLVAFRWSCHDLARNLAWLVW